MPQQRVLSLYTPENVASACKTLFSDTPYKKYFNDLQKFRQDEVWRERSESNIHSLILPIIVTQNCEVSRAAVEKCMRKSYNYFHKDSEFEKLKSSFDKLETNMAVFIQSNRGLLVEDSKEATCSDDVVIVISDSSEVNTYENNNHASAVDLNNSSSPPWASEISTAITSRYPESWFTVTCDLVDCASLIAGKKNLTSKLTSFFDLTSESYTDPVDFPWHCKNTCEENCEKCKHFETNYIADYAMCKSSLQTLAEDEELDDNIINGAALLCTEIASQRNFDVLYFSTTMSEEIFNSRVSSDFQDWLLNNKSIKTSVWLVPVHLIFNVKNKRLKEEIHHWVLAVVNFAEKVIVYLDSCHDKMDKALFDKLCAFIEICTGEKIGKDWRLYEPTDTPQQSGRKCGLYVITWIYIICAGRALRFCDKDMDQIRRCLIHELRTRSVSSSRAAEWQVLENLLFQGDSLKVQCYKHACTRVKKFRRSTLDMLSTLKDGNVFQVK